MDEIENHNEKKNNGVLHLVVLVGCQNIIPLNNIFKNNC